MSPVLGRGLLNRSNQLARLKGLSQKRYAACFQCLPANCFVLKAGYEDDRECGIGSRELVPQFDTRHAAAEMNVEKQTIDPSCTPAGEKFLRRCKDSGSKTMCIQ